jgi:hypothetical protein
MGKVAFKFTTFELETLPLSMIIVQWGDAYSGSHVL